MSERSVAINLMVGTACNWHCPYCLQDSEAGFDKKLDVSVFCDKFTNYIKDNNIQIKRIAYWGGEPVLYWKYIKAIEECVVPEVKPLRPSRFITNGSLITSEHVDFFNSRDMLVNVSYHDGQLSDESWRTCMNIKELYVTSLVHHKCLSWDRYRDKWQYLWDKFGRCVSWFVYPIHYTNGLPKEYAFTLSDIDNYIEYLYSIISLAYNDIFYQRMLEILFYSYYEHDYYAEDLNFCYCNGVLSVDLKGNKYFCHHDCTANNIVGNIFDKLAIHKDDSEFLNKLRVHRLQCKTCPCYTHCLGGCFRDQQPEISCYFKLKMRTLLLYIKQHHYSLVSKEYMAMVD